MSVAKELDLTSLPSSSSRFAGTFIHSLNLVRGNIGGSLFGIAMQDVVCMGANTEGLVSRLMTGGRTWRGISTSDSSGSLSIEGSVGGLVGSKCPGIVEDIALLYAASLVAVIPSLIVG